MTNIVDCDLNAIRIGQSITFAGTLPECFTELGRAIGAEEIGPAR